MLGRALEARAIGYDDVHGPDVGSFDTVDSWGGTGRSTHAGVRVTQDNALEVGALWACVSLIADCIASFPIDTFEPDGSGGRRETEPPDWLRQPNVEQTPYDFWFRFVVSLLLDGTGLAHLTGDHDQPTEAWALNPRDVVIARRRGELVYKVGGEGGEELDRHNVLQVNGFVRPGDVRGVSPVAAGRQDIGLAKVADEFAARFFSNGASVGGVLESDRDLTADQINTLRTQFEKKHRGVKKSHRPLVLANGLKWSRTQVPPSEAQMLETRQRQVEEIARRYRVPLSLIGEITKHASAGGGKGMATLDLGFLKHTLRPWIVRIEQAVSAKLPGREFMRFNVSALLRADDLTRWSVYAQMRNTGAAFIDEIRAWEDLAPLPDGLGQNPFTPLNSSSSGSTDSGLGGATDPTEPTSA